MDPADSRGGGEVASPKLRRSCSSFRRWELSPIRYLKLVGGKVVLAALRIMYPAAAKSGARNRKVTSSSSENATPAAAAARLAVDDSHRAEAVKDCIHFMNNISTVPRSNSLSCKP
nr:josephin-like protein [Ipomoea batatas]